MNPSSPLELGQDVTGSFILKKPHPPDLLLSYTYFINSHSFYINSGYNIETFKLQTVLCKNGTFIILNYDDWSNLFCNKTSIDNHFGDKTQRFNGELPKVGGKCSFRLTTRTKDQALLISDGYGKKIVFHTSEWKYFSEMIIYLNSVVMWQNSITTEIQKYYDLYLQRCVNANKLKLSHQEFFIPTSTANCYTYIYCDYSRLFSEISIFCNFKLNNDFYSSKWKKYDKSFI